jgi:hypothetical protein
MNKYQERKDKMIEKSKKLIQKLEEKKAQEEIIIKEILEREDSVENKTEELKMYFRALCFTMDQIKLHDAILQSRGIEYLGYLRDDQDMKDLKQEIREKLNIPEEYTLF